MSKGSQEEKKKGGVVAIERWSDFIDRHLGLCLPGKGTTSRLHPEMSSPSPVPASPAEGTACPLVWTSPKGGDSVHLKGVSKQPLGCKKEMLEHWNVDYLKIREICHFEYLIYGLTVAPTLGRDVRWSGFTYHKWRFYGRAGASQFRVGGGGIGCGIPLLSALPASANTRPFVYARLRGFTDHSI